MARPWRSLAGLQGEAAACTCSDMQLAHVGCDCRAQQNLPVGCTRHCGAWLRTREEIDRGTCALCTADKYQPGDRVEWEPPYLQSR